ncbi:MAG: hypothetical protein ACRER2_04795 [Methylococcales bacterium]
MWKIKSRAKLWFSAKALLWVKIRLIKELIVATEFGTAKSPAGIYQGQRPARYCGAGAYVCKAALRKADASGSHDRHGTADELGSILSKKNPETLDLEGYG